MNQSAKFWDKIAERYSKRPVTDEAAYQKKLQITRQYLHPDAQVLEFACGTGSAAIAHAPYVKHIHAIDFSPKMIEIAKDKADQENIRNITFGCSTIEEFNLPDQSLDLILGLNILHLLDNKEEVIAKAYKLLKPGGIFISSTACLGDFMKLFKIIAPIGKFFRLMPLVRVFTAGELETSMTNAGFEIDHKWQPGKNKALFLVLKKAK
ncbi:MAG: class I SAM-dependent methyltransferase [Gammaproteobacteria bacterium]|nr:class I SAM-dependent methyltransferase [Gammaproteobacteria bacterium]